MDADGLNDLESTPDFQLVGQTLLLDGGQLRLVRGLTSHILRLLLSIRRGAQLRDLIVRHVAQLLHSASHEDARLPGGRRHLRHVVPTKPQHDRVQGLVGEVRAGSTPSITSKVLAKGASSGDDWYTYWICPVHRAALEWCCSTRFWRLPTASSALAQPTAPGDSSAGAAIAKPFRLLPIGFLTQTSTMHVHSM